MKKPKTKKKPSPALVGNLLAGAVATMKQDDPSFSQHRLANLVGLSQSGISRIISGERTASEQTIAALSRELGAAFPLDEAWRARQADIAFGLQDEQQRFHAWALIKPYARLRRILRERIATLTDDAREEYRGFERELDREEGPEPPVT